MSGHLSFPELSGPGIPASLSRSLIQEELRGFLGFNGLLITDDLYMSGASGELSIAETCEQAIRAGNDMVLLSVTPDVDGSLWRYLFNLYREDPEFASCVRKAAVRVLETKIAYLKPLGPKEVIPSPEKSLTGLPDPEAKAFFAELARRSATLIQGRGSLPFKPEGQVLLAGAYDSFLALGLKSYPGAQTMKIRSAEQLAEFTRRLDQVDAVILCISSESHRPFAFAARDKRLPLAVVSVLSPYRARDLDFADAIVAVYHYAEICLAAGFEVLEGKLLPRGILPFNMEKR
jgi:beta-N-acetylhexosaminidase